MQVKDLMVKNSYLLLFLIFLAITKKGISQIFPMEGSKLNYVLVPFSVTKDIVAGHTKGTGGYEIKIAKGNYSEVGDFEKNIILSHKDTGSVALIQLPEFGEGYTWLVEYKQKKKTVKSNLYHFSTMTSPYVDKSRYRLRVLKNVYPDPNLLFFLDHSRVTYNGKGEPVWFLPNIESVVDDKSQIRDMRMTGRNTITLLTGDGAYEIDYNAKVLWAKTGEEVLKDRKMTLGEDDRNITRDICHHEFVRLERGGYMLMSRENALRKLPFGDSVRLEGRQAVKKNDGYYKKVEFGVLMEYDVAGNLVWEWKAADYFRDKEIFRKRGNNPDANVYVATTHMNAFHFNERDSVIYVGFRDISRIVKIKYPEGDELASFGAVSSGATPMFSLQHSIALNKEGDIYVFSNNASPEVQNDQNASSIVIIREAERKGGIAEKTWEFSCDIDTNAKYVGFRGGNAVEMADGNYISCMGTSPRIFIVNKEKEVLFNAISEQWDQVQKTWVPFAQYRVAPFFKHNILPAN